MVVLNVCFDWCVVYGVDVCGVVCVIEFCLFLESGYCMLCGCVGCCDFCIDLRAFVGVVVYMFVACELGVESNS